MTRERKGRFSGRAFISITTGVSFLGMAVTGLVLFVVPPGRIANWTGWTIFGLTKHQWIGLHIWFSLVFMLAAFFHIWFNWRPLVNYFKSKVSQHLALRREWVSAFLLCVVVLLGTLAEIRPFSSLLAWNEAIKHSWDETDRRAPVPHAELLTLAELAGYVDDVGVETIIENLAARGIEVDSSQRVVGELAEAHNMTPNELYDIAVGAMPSGRGRGGAGQGRGGYGQGGGPEHDGRRGIGRMTLKAYCAEAQLNLAHAIDKLRQAGLNATGEMTIRDIADAAGLHPSEVRSLLE